LNLKFGFISLKERWIADEVSSFFSRGIAEGSILGKKKWKIRGKALSFCERNPKFRFWRK